MFTIVMATCDRPDRLVKALEAVGRSFDALGCGPGVIVVDNGAQRLAGDAVAAFSSRVAGDVRCLRSGPRNKSAALNTGIRAAETDWLAFTDDDCLPATDWLVRAAAYARRHEARVFGGRVEPGGIDVGLPGWLRPGRSGRIPRGPAIVDYAPMFESGLLDERMRVPLGANVFVGKDVFERYGGYDEGLWRRCGGAALGSEDAEFGMRLRAAGEPIGYCAEAVVVHPVTADRARLSHHLAWAFRIGFREYILFPEEGRTVSAAYLARRAAAALCRGLLDLARGDRAACVCDLMDAAEAAGRLRGRKIGRRA